MLDVHVLCYFFLCPCYLCYLYMPSGLAAWARALLTYLVSLDRSVISGNTGIGENREEQTDRIGNVITVETLYLFYLHVQCLL